MAKTKRISRALLWGALSILCESSFAATYYVAVNGSDSNPGTSASPFLTIQKGVNAASAGDTIIVGNGTYTYGGGAGGNFVTIGKAGNSGAWITLEAQNKGQAFLNGNNNTGGYGINFSGGSAYWIIKGFDISWFRNMGVMSNSGGGKNIQILQNTIHNIGNVTDNSTAFGECGIYTDPSAANWTIDGNVFHDVGRLAYLTGTHDHSIYTHGTNMLTTNNVFYSILNGWHFQTAAGYSGTIANNTFFGPDPWPGQYGQIMLWDVISNVIIKNNIFYNPGGYGISTYALSISGTCSFDHNIMFKSGSSVGLITSMPSNCVQSNNLANVDPMLTTPSIPNFNFHLLAGSPAIGAGVVMSQVPADFDGNSRGSRNDLGAFEYGGTAPPPPPAVAISAVSVTGVAQTAATIGWTTNVAADGQVVYGLTSAYGSASTLNTTKTTGHSVVLSGLTAGTVYHYSIKSHDGTLAASPDATFTTSASGVAPPPGCVTSAGSVWQNGPLAAQTGSFTAGFDVTPAASNMDSVAGLSNGPAAGYTALAAAVGFNNTGMIDARNGGVYAAAASIPYVGGLSYHVRLVVNLAAHTYSSYVKQGSNAEQLIGANYAFRTEQAAVASLSSVGVFADVGSLTVCNPVVTALTSLVISAVSTSGIAQTTATILWTTNNPADSQVQYGPTTAYGATTTLSAALATSHSVGLGGLAAGTVYHYRVLSRDASGSLATSPDATFTTAAVVVSPPVISAVSATGIASSGAAVNWTTDKPADSQVVYVANSGVVTVIPVGSFYTSSTTLDPTLKTSHSVALTGLTAGTVYHYAVKSRDSAGNLTTSPDGTFTTAAGSVTPPPGCVTSSGSVWKNVSLTAQTGSFTAEFDVTPAAANMDSVSGLSNGPAAGWSSLAAEVGFNNVGVITARNGNVFTAAASIPYVAGLAYHVRLVVNPAAHTYSAYVKQGVNAEQLLGSNYAFRTEQSAAKLLNNLGAFADVGSLTVCNATVHL